MKKQSYNMETNNEEKMVFSAIVHTDKPFVPQVMDKKASGTKWIKWGEKNDIPNFLWDAYLNCAIEQSAVNTTMDYLVGDGIQHNFLYDDHFDEVMQQAIFDYVLFGGFALEGIRNSNGEIVVLNYVNVMNVRVNEALTTAYLSNKWGNYGGKDVIELPLFNPDEKQNHFIFYYRGALTRNINPVPMYIAGLKSIEILNRTRNFHLRNLENNFSVSAIINLNNGQIKSRELQEIKEKLEDNYCGDEHAGKFLLINSPDKEHSATIERLNADDFGDLYKSLAESSVDDVYAAFRLNKMLVGINVQTGFSKEEFQNAYALYARTVIRPLQNNIKRAMSYLGVEINFLPFTINWSE